MKWASDQDREDKMKEEARKAAEASTKDMPQGMKDRAKEETENTKRLQRLGVKTEYRYENPSVEMLDTFDNPRPTHPYAITFATDEFTSLCPKTGQPDFAKITINYQPMLMCVETKSLKMYLFAYRQT